MKGLRIGDRVVLIKEAIKNIDDGRIVIRRGEIGTIKKTDDVHNTYSVEWDEYHIKKNMCRDCCQLGYGYLMFEYEIDLYECVTDCNFEGIGELL